MKPRTRIHKEVHPLMGALPRLTAEQKQFAKKKLFKSHLYRTKESITCLDCGHRWGSSDGGLSVALLGVDCPHCGEGLNQMDSPRKRTIKKEEYICQSLTVKGFQVFRFFYVQKSCKVSEKAQYFFEEVANHWIRERDGKLVMASIKYNAFGYGEKWSHGTAIEIRNTNDRFYIYPKAYFPNKRVLKVLRRNGYKGGFKQLQPTYFTELLLTDHKAETLLKSKQIAIFNNYFNLAHNVEKYWPSIKIAIRHHYTISNPSDWFDHLDLLSYFDKDILNPTVICVEEFRTEHQRLNDKKNAIEAKIRYEQEKERLDEADKRYKKVKRNFLKLNFKEGDISVAPLGSVQEFYEEAEIMHHCVSSYHDRDQSLILSAKLNGKRMETVEVSLNDFTIRQCRGLQNESTKHHKQIISLVESNINKIKKATKSKVT